jgi:C4-type Zn-finger protein
MANEKMICPICGKAELTPNEHNSNLCYWNTDEEDVWLGCDNCGHSFKIKKEGKNYVH